MTKERGKRKSMSQEHNDLVDELAKVSLQLGVQTGRFAASELPLEDVWLTREGKKITGSVGNNLREQWARKSAKRYFDEKNIVLEENFDLVWWECIDKAGMNWTQMYKVWVTKQVSDCCGTNKRLSYWEKHTKAQCSFCEEEETSMHITRCQHPTRRKLLNKTAREILAWMIDTGVGLDLADIVYQ